MHSRTSLEIQSSLINKTHRSTFPLGHHLTIKRSSSATLFLSAYNNFIWDFNWQPHKKWISSWRLQRDQTFKLATKIKGEKVTKKTFWSWYGRTVVSNGIININFCLLLYLTNTFIIIFSHLSPRHIIEPLTLSEWKHTSFTDRSLWRETSKVLVLMMIW